MNLFLASVVRHLLSALAGSLVYIGVTDHDATSFVQAAEPVVTGAIVYGAVQAWSLVDKKRR
jgi:hypothetical protein